ncbi:MAG TPA: hypothetical protein PKC40_09720 [Saprospiraceae bacterium]|nr:hypothetical protein [Saprospiraceae bacterium]
MKPVFKLVFLLTSLTMVALLSSCHRYYTAPDFDAITANHKTVAVLPFKMVLTGRLPNDWTEERKEKIETLESEAFQRSFLNEIYRSTRNGKKNFKVNFQNVDKTNALLKENNIDVRESWYKDPQELAQLLGVDAVVRAEVRKHRYLSNWESLAIDWADDILAAALGTGTILPWNATKTNDVDISLTVVENENGTVLFNASRTCQVDWRQPANDAIDGINRSIAKAFPYRANK